MLYTFNEFQLDTKRRTLQRAGESVRIEPKPLDLLVYLVENRGRLVTKQELAEVVWQGTVVSRSALPLAVHSVRKAIRQAQGARAPIATIGHEGYSFSEPVEARELAGRPGLDVASPFVGRGELMGRLTEHLANARAGHGHIVILAGEAGIGKSRAAQEIGAHARQHGIAPWTGYCVEGAGAPPLWPWRQVIGASLNTLSARQLGQLLKDGLPEEIERLFPELSEVLVRWHQPPSLERGSAQHRLCETLARLVIGPSPTRPRLIVLDDLQWADVASLELLQHLSLRIAGVQLLVVATLRDDDVGPHDVRYQHLHRLFRSPACSRMSLSPLTASDVREFVVGLMGDSEGAKIAGTVFQKTEGNPLFVGETVRWLMSEEAGRSRSTARSVDPSELPVPDAVRAVIMRRIHTVRPQTLELLASAAVIGEEFNLSLLFHTVGGDAAEHLTRLEEAASAQLLSAPPKTAGSCRFAHVLIRDVIYENLPLSVRAETHVRIAEIQEVQAGPDPDRCLSELALHFYRGLPRTPAKAFRYCFRAARALHALFAYDQACTLYERALEAWSFQSDVQETHVQRCVALLGLAQCALSASKGPEACEIVAEAIRAARGLGRPDLLAQGVVLANIYALAGHAPPESIRDLAEEALSQLSERFPIVRAYLLSSIASDPSVIFERRRALAIEAMDLVVLGEGPFATDDILRIDMDIMRGEAVRYCFGSLGPDDLDLSLRFATRVIELVDHDRDLHSAWVAHRSRAKVHLGLGDLAAADADLKCSRQIAHRTRSAMLHFEEISIEGYRALIVGDFAEAERSIERLRDTHAVSLASSHRELLQRLRILLLHQDRGDLTGAPISEDLWESAPADMVRAYQFPKIAAETLSIRICVGAGRLDIARRKFDALAEGGFDSIPRDAFYLTTLCELACLSAVFNNRARAREIYALLLPYASLCAVQIPLHYAGPVAHFLGMLARTFGEWSAAIEHLDRSAAIGARLGALPMLNRTRVELVSVLVGHADGASRGRASAILSETLASARELGMTRMCYEIELLHARLSRGLVAASSAS